MLFTGLGLARIVKSYDHTLEMLPFACSLGSNFNTSVTVFHYSRPPSWLITVIMTQRRLIQSTNYRLETLTILHNSDKLYRQYSL